MTEEEKDTIVGALLAAPSLALAAPSPASEADKKASEEGKKGVGSAREGAASSAPTLSLFTASLPVAASLECLLFVAGEPVSLADLARALERDENETEAALRELQVHLVERGSGLQLLRIAGGWQFATRPEYATVVARMLARGANKLSRAAMETLAIIAYRQPITAPEIEAVRGVSVSGVLKTLLERRLIVEAGRKAALGRPMLYVTTPDFLHYFAIADLGQLPPLEADAPIPPPVSAASVTDGRQSSSPGDLPASDADMPPPLLLSPKLLQDQPSEN